MKTKKRLTKTHRTLSMANSELIKTGRRSTETKQLSIKDQHNVYYDRHGVS